mmetsp:Transcript_1864/g.3988  ORF Transcript_1864/g.3988 Transcript_1864/m.3988 type:complete len:308 (+) Transcript_1864:576-1499(+)
MTGPRRHLSIDAFLQRTRPLDKPEHRELTRGRVRADRPGQRLLGKFVPCRRQHAHRAVPVRPRHQLPDPALISIVSVFSHEQVEGHRHEPPAQRHQCARRREGGHAVLLFRTVGDVGAQDVAPGRQRGRGVAVVPERVGGREGARVVDGGPAHHGTDAAACEPVPHVHHGGEAAVRHEFRVRKFRRQQIHDARAEGGDAPVADGAHPGLAFRGVLGPFMVNVGRCGWHDGRSSLIAAARRHPQRRRRRRRRVRGVKIPQQPESRVHLHLGHVRPERHRPHELATFPKRRVVVARVRVGAVVGRVAHA